MNAAQAMAQENPVSYGKQKRMEREENVEKTPADPVYSQVPQHAVSDRETALLTRCGEFLTKFYDGKTPISITVRETHQLDEKYHSVDFTANIG